MAVPRPFHKEFHTLDYALRHAKRVLLFAHEHPDPDAVGSVVGLKAFIKEHYHTHVTIGCFHDFPDFLEPVFGAQEFVHPDALSLNDYDVAIGCDSVDRGFDVIVPQLPEHCVSIAVDHHHDITLSTDVRIIDAAYASTTEILYRFALFCRQRISPRVAMAYLTGIIGDTGIFQHANTHAHTLAAAADLVRHGASVARIVRATFAHQKVETLHLWGRALEGAQFFEDTGLIVTAVTQEDLAGQNPTSEEIKEVANILTTVPGVRVALFLYQVAPRRIKASLRAPQDAGIDVSAIAHQFGGGGHPLASGFEMPGRIIKQKDSMWRIV